MKKIQILVLVAFTPVLLTGCKTSGINRGGDSTYAVSAQYGSLNGGWERASQEAMQKANSFCDKKGRKFVFFNEKRDGIVDWSSQTSIISFRCEDIDTTLASNASEKTINIKEKEGDIFPSEALNDERYKLDVKKITSPKTDNDAVAIIIGIQNYKRLGKADFANKDAQKFYEYAYRALGIPKDRIKILTDADADQAAFLKSFRNWLPLYVKKNKTEVFVFYSGHGLPSPDGKSLYFLPYGVDQDLLDETAIDQRKIVAAIQATQPKSVTMFIDSCYSGLSKTGEILLSGSKPVTLKISDMDYPTGFTVMTASAPDQISSSSTELQHGIFSFYLMKGMEGDADSNNDKNITVGEMQKFLLDNVQLRAMSLNRKQIPQVVGNTDRVLVGR
jgi:Caspase domain